MIVLDEQLNDSQIIQAVARWYPGAVKTIEQLRSLSVVKDDAVPTLLRTVRQPTFATMNYDDFWKVIAADPAFCIVCCRLPSSRVLEFPQMLRSVLSQPQYRTKRQRMGLVISVTSVFADYR